MTSESSEGSWPLPFAAVGPADNNHNRSRRQKLHKYTKSKLGKTAGAAHACHRLSCQLRARGGARTQEGRRGQDGGAGAGGGQRGPGGGGTLTPPPAAATLRRASAAVEPATWRLRHSASALSERPSLPRRRALWVPSSWTRTRCAGGRGHPKRA